MGEEESFRPMAAAIPGQNPQQGRKSEFRRKGLRTRGGVLGQTIYRWRQGSVPSSCYPSSRAPSILGVLQSWSQQPSSLWSLFIALACPLGIAQSPLSFGASWTRADESLLWLLSGIVVTWPWAFMVWWAIKHPWCSTPFIDFKLPLVIGGRGTIKCLPY